MKNIGLLLGIIMMSATSLFATEITDNHLYNPEVVDVELMPGDASTFNLVSTEFVLVDSTMYLKFVTEAETAPLTFYIEEYVHDMWDLVGTIEGKGGIETKEYMFRMPSIAGTNKLRISQRNTADVRGRYYEVEVVSPKSKPVVIKSIVQKGGVNEIQFSGETRYCVIDMLGIKHAWGVGDKVDITKIPSGKYFIYFENDLAKFKRK